ncbi:NADPH-dependent F420 reductase [Sandaracinus amylolyticus]|uniref:NADPH-dependent F420 reductase n=1 Tax=Sandaracinus amylolyticus TaxID=927083 RepID=UPI001F3009A8|nr:NAD(P)-binding domain-containing protein [Sandaracinus amylolyticus]UJR82843.1 Hypothetical protein I5071_49080 [Sandaracinus amylolyticus]
MTIGIIGAGNIGSALATALARAHVPAMLANRRGPDSLRDVIAPLAPFITAGMVQDAARADLVVVAVPWSQLPAALRDLGPWNGRIVVDANNPIEAPRFEPADLGGRLSSEVFADLVPGARVVKAFNHLPPPLLAGDPAGHGGKRVLFHSGDDAAAKAEVSGLIARLGFFGIDLGALAVGARLVQFPGGPLPALHLVRIDHS